MLRQALLLRCDVNLPQHRVAVANPRVNASICEVHDANHCCGLLFCEERLRWEEAVALIWRLILWCKRMTSCKARMTFMRITLDRDEWLE